MMFRPGFAIFRDCGFTNSSLNVRSCCAATGRHAYSSHGEIMDSTIQKSCWGVTVRAVVGFAGLLLLAFLFGGI
jgi:hypothetical protein